MGIKIYKKFLAANLIVGLASLSTQLQGLLLIPLIVKISGPAVYGAYVLLASIFLIALTVSTMGIGYRYRRLLPSTDDPAARAEVFFSGIIGQSLSVCVGMLLLILVFPFLEQVFLKESVPLPRVWIPVFCLAYLFHTQACEYFRYTHRMALFSLALIAVNFVSVAILVGLVAAGAVMNLELLFGVQAASYAGVGLVFWWIIIRELPWRPRLSSFGQYLQDASIGFPLVLSGLAEMISAVSDRYVIGARLSTEAIGLYAPACALGSMVLFIPRISGVVLPPMLAQAVDGEQTAAGDTLVRYNIRLFLLLGIPTIAGGAVVAEPALRFLANEHVASAGKYVVPIIAAASLFYGMAYILNGVFFVQRRTKAILASNLTVGLVKIVLGFAALALHTGLCGVAVAALLGQIAGLAVLLQGTIVSRAMIWDGVFFLKLMTASLVMLGALIMIKTPLSQLMSGAPLVFILVAAGICFYGSGLFLFRVFDVREIEFFKKFLGKYGRLLPQG